MASYGTNTTHRPMTTSPPPSTPTEADESKAPTGKNHHDFDFIFHFNLPTTPESAAVRIIRNINHFKLYYTIFIWVVLFIALVPKRKISLLFLVAMTSLTGLYLLLLRSLPSSALLHKIVDKRLVLFLVVIATMVEMILTRAAIHFFVTLAATTPVILAHAVLWVRDNVYVIGEACAVNQNTGDVELMDSV